MDLSNLRIDGTVFFGHHMTYMLLLKDISSIMAQTTLISNSISMGTCTGISIKTQLFYLLSYVFRLVENNPFQYWDYGVLSTLLFISIISFSIFICCIHWTEYDSKMDSFWFKGSFALTIFLAITFNYSHLDLTLPLFLWAWSHYLEGMAILPQLWIMIKMSNDCKSLSTRGPRSFIGFLVIARLLEMAHKTILYYDMEMLDSIGLYCDIFFVSIASIYAAIMIYKQMKNLLGRCEC